MYPLFFLVVVLSFSGGYASHFQVSKHASISLALQVFHISELYVRWDWLTLSVFVTYDFLFLCWGIPQEETKGSKQNVHDSNYGHHPGEANSLSNGSSNWRTYINQGQIYMLRYTLCFVEASTSQLQRHQFSNQKTTVLLKQCCPTKAIM